MLTTKEIMEMTGQTKWAVIASLRDKRFTRQVLSVEKWIAEGKQVRKLKRHNLDFESLEIGDSLEIESKSDLQYVRNRASQMGKRLSRKFEVNSIEMKVTRTA